MFKSPLIKFRVEKSNTGMVALGRNYDRLVILKREDGAPIQPGELVPGQVITVDVYTGMVRKENMK